MNKLSSVIAEKQSSTSEGDILSAFRKKKPLQIQRSMQPEEIAEIISDRLINIVKSQFDRAELEYRNSKK